MFTLFVLLVVVATVSAKFSERHEEHFETFKKDFHRKYDTEEEHGKRKEIFRQRMIKVDELNEINVKENGEQVFGVTKFADWTDEEFGVMLGRKNHGAGVDASVPTKEPKAFKSNVRGAQVGIPSYVNWGESGKVTPVKNQGQCGTCWAFSTAETVESQWAMNGNALWQFSVQQIASCTTTCNGCGGGDTIYAYQYLASNTAFGLGSDAWAPYVQSMTSSCNGPKCTEACSSLDFSVLPSKAFYTGPYATLPATNMYTYATPGCTGACSGQNTTLLAANIATYGPASICVNAANWGAYTGGVLSQSACGGYSYSSLDHCVQLTGYNAAATNPYWIVRNSWATNWGERGYILLQYPQNSCGLADEATFVTITNSDANFTSTA